MKLFTRLPNVWKIEIKMEHHTNLKMKSYKARNKLDLFMLFFSKI